MKKRIKNKHISTFLLASSIIIASNYSIVSASEELPENTNCTYLMTRYSDIPTKQKDEILNKINLASSDKTFSATQLLINSKGDYIAIGDFKDADNKDTIKVAHYSSDLKKLNEQVIKGSTNKKVIQVKALYNDNYIISYHNTENSNTGLMKLDMNDFVLFDKELAIKSIDNMSISQDNKFIMVEYLEKSTPMVNIFNIDGDFIEKTILKKEDITNNTPNNSTITVNHFFTKSSDLINNRGAEIILTASDPTGIKQITDPDGKIYTSDNLKFFAIKNGEYHFKVENNKGEFFIYTIPVRNIDKESPTISVTGKYNESSKQTDYTIKTKDNLAGVKYIILPDGKKVYSDTALYTGEAQEQLIIKAYDNVCNRLIKTIKLDEITPPEEKPISKPPEEKPTPEEKPITKPAEEKPIPEEKPITKPVEENTVESSKNNPETGDSGSSMYLIGSVVSITALAITSILYRINTIKKKLLKEKENDNIK